MSVTVDIKAKRFGAADQAWRLFPGVGYRHYEVMREYSRVFIDLPVLPALPRGEISKDTFPISDLARSMSLAPLVFRTDDKAADRVDELKSSDFGGARWSQRRSVALGWIKALYRTASIGDIVVVPGPGYRKNEEGELELKPSLIGEIVGETERWTENGPQQYTSARLLTRRVRWFPDAQEDQLSAKTALLLRTQNALIAMPKDELEGVLGAAFKNVVTDDETIARFTTKNLDFRSYDAHQFLAFVQAVTAALKAAKEGEELVHQSVYEIAGRMQRDLRYVVEQDANIHSPGYSTLKMALAEAAGTAKNVPLVVATLFAIATSPGAQPFDAENQPDVNLSNSESAALDPCDPEFGLEQDVRDTLAIIGLDRWRDEFCPVAQAAQQHEGFKSLSTVPNTGN